MSNINGLPVYTALDEQRFNLWMSRLEDSYKNYLEVSSNENDGLKKEELLDAIRNTLKTDLEKYPHWIAAQKAVPASKLASSSTDMKTFLRHIAFPHVLTSYHNIVNEICPADVPHVEKLSVDAVVPDTSDIASAAEPLSPETVAAVEPVSSPSAASETVTPMTTSVPETTSTIATSYRHAKATLKVPIHTAPIVTVPGARETAVEDFFRGLSRGHGDGLVNLCKLADIHHRINRACEHDTHQVAQWVQNEQTRREEHSCSLEQRRARLQVLRGEDEQGVIQHAVVKLKAEVGVLSKQLSQAEREEEEARRIYEAAILKRRQATQNIVNLESYIDNVALQRDLLKKVNELRIEADKYNIESAESRVVMFQGLEKYVQSVSERFVQQRLSEEMPQLFANLVNVFEHILVPQAGDPNCEKSKCDEMLSLFCASRVGLETIRIWQQLNLHVIQPSMVTAIEQFETRLKAVQATQRLPAPTDADAAMVYKANNATVVLFFDHLAHDTPEDHVEANSRVLTCLKMLTEHLQNELGAMEVDADYLSAKGRRSMQLLNCNDVLSPPVWCLPLAHSPQYLAQLWRLAEEAHQGDLYVPLEFDTEWVSEDPYHTSSDEDTGAKRRSRTSSSNVGNLMQNVDFDAPWANAMDEAQRAEFVKLLTPVSSDHAVAKVIKRMDARAAARTHRGGVKLGPGRPRNEDRAAAAAATASATAAGASSTTSQSSAYANTRELAVDTKVQVRTPMGPGTVLQNYRRDGLVSVTLQWGAVGHFHKSSVVYLNQAPVVDPRKAERPSFSAAQAFYVNGSAGRFLHNDMELHNTMARLVSLVRVQRIIGDFVVINHANLSLYMHGRTSSGLTKTIEATIGKWVYKFDQTKLNALLDFAEQSNARGNTVDPQDFLKMLQKTALPEGQSGSAAQNRQKAVTAAFESLPDDADDDEEEEVRNVKKPISALSVIPKSTSAPVGANGLHQSSSMQSITSSVELSAVTPKKESRQKNPTDVRTLAKYSKDGETLRELMLTIMRNLKISQGSIANEYYRNFRYETSQGGVSAWFHFRGNSSTFDAMNHCAMMWAEDHKDQLQPDEQSLLGEVCQRMSQAQHTHGNSHTMPTHHPTSHSTASKSVDTGAALNEANLASASAMSVSAGDLTQGAAALVNNGCSDDEATPVGLPLNGAMEVSSTVASSGNTVSSDDEAEDDGAMDEDVAPSTAAAPHSEDLVQDVSGLDRAVEAIVRQVVATEASKPLVQATSSNGAAHSPAGAVNLLSAGPLTAHTATTQLASTLDATIKKEPVADTSGAAPNGTHAHAGEHMSAASAFEPKQIVKEETESDAHFSRGEDIRTIEDLHRTVVYEMNRRKVSQSKAAIEANLRELGMGQPALSKFLSVATINNNDRGKQFSEYMIIWVKYSQQLPAADDFDPTNVPVYRPPRPAGSSAIASFSAKPVAPVYAKADFASASTVPSRPKSPVAGDAGGDGESDGDEVLSAEEEVEQDTGSLGDVPQMHQFAAGFGLGRSFPPRAPVAAPSIRHPARVVEEDDLTCGLCGKMSVEFITNKSFHMHLAWCYRRKNQSRPPPDHMLRTGGVGSNTLAADWVSNSSNAHRKRKPAAGLDDPIKRPRAADFRPQGSELTKDTYVIAADSFKLGHHYDSCEMCKDHGEVLKCASCPCIYHPRCADVAAAPESGVWHCPKCVETGAAVGEIVPEEQKSSPSFADSWILIYSDALHRWRKAVVLEVHSTRPGVVLVKWWRIDNKGGKTNWLDLSNSTILGASAERLGAPPSRSRAPSTAAALTNARDRQQTVRFEQESFERKKSSQNNNRFRDNHGMMFMDGETGGSVPPLVRASAAGIGGVAALRDGEYEEEKGGSGSLSISGSGMSDTYLSSNSLKAALCASGSACRAVDIAICNDNTNVFVCSRPPGHHAGRYGCTGGCLSTGFCLLNNAAIAAIYGRVRWGLERVAVVDIDVHFGNGTAELLRNDPNAFFASVHMIYGEDNDGLKAENNQTINLEADGKTHTHKPRASTSTGFYPARMGLTEVTDTYVSVGVYPTVESSRARGGGPKRKPKVVVPLEESAESSEEEVEVEPEADVEGEGDAEKEGSIDLEGAKTDGAEAGDEMEMELETDAVPSAADQTGTAPKSSEASSGTKSNNSSSSAASKAFVGSEGFLRALSEVIIPQMEKYRPQLLIISAGFDGYVSDPLGGQLCLSLEDYKVATKMLMAGMDRIKASETNPELITGKVISLLEGGYDTSPFTLGLAKCVDAHVHALQEG